MPRRRIAPSRSLPGIAAHDVAMQRTMLQRCALLYCNAAHYVATQGMMWQCSAPCCNAAHYYIAMQRTMLQRCALLWCNAAHYCVATQQRSAVVCCNAAHYHDVATQRISMLQHAPCCDSRGDIAAQRVVRHARDGVGIAEQRGKQRQHVGPVECGGVCSGDEGQMR
jgi:hypothetical protein